MNLHVDLGQVIIVCAISMIGYLVKTEVSNFRTQLARHEELIIKLVGDVQRLIGYQNAWQGNERRFREKNHPS